MGFTTGLLGGFTLTTAVIYLSIEMHTRNRQRQAALLNQQARLLKNVTDPQPPGPPPPAREIPAGLIETAKDRWNARLEEDVRKLQNTDWDGLRESVEESISAVWRRAFQKSREGVAEASNEVSKQLEKVK
ncbi:hypothetical protein K431DRAFT_247052 [Polychaeton citri CBS 116435]|uniref:MICOS complex subunit MIC12 n=1 Tax=Polychaeton citri CBS 116435 TaxID=1314669 RepID=A0A9P4Q8C4_9PEZI|nr:hypothetical protein K431DRAFT_247052 [Polychaeton citri CBS 116435]